MSTYTALNMIWDFAASLRVVSYSEWAGSVQGEMHPRRGLYQNVQALFPVVCGSDYIFDQYSRGAISIRSSAELPFAFAHGDEADEASLEKTPLLVLDC